MAFKMKNFTKLLDLLRESDQSCVLPKTGFIELIDEVNVDASDCPLSQLLSRIIKVKLEYMNSGYHFANENSQPLLAYVEFLKPTYKLKLVLI